MQIKSKTRSINQKIIASVLVVMMVALSAVPVITSGIGSAMAASVAEDAVGASNEYNAPVNGSNSANADLYWSDATYFDYLSDAEISNGWLNTVKAGTGFNGSADEWYPYYLFNRDVVKSAADSNSSWSTPLYFGNFCNTNGAYDTSAHHVGGSGSGYADATNDYNVTRFNYAANNSNGLSNLNESYQGLVQNTLDSNGNLMVTSTLKAPYFDKELLTGSKSNYAKIVNSKFPFTKTQMTNYTYYEFDSSGAKDNVYFTWDSGVPKSVNYGSGTGYGVKDGIDYFMNPDEGQHSGYGIFPFNNRTANANQNTGTRYIYLNKDNTNWGDTYCYFYSGTSTVGATWPGTKMSSYDGSSNLRIPIPSGATGLVFNNGSGSQTGNVTNLSKGAFWLGSDLSVHEWDVAPGDAGTGSSTPSENLDYGFGIKMNMRFRVPKNGTVDGTTNGKAVEFNYSGDDDLWIFITDLKTNQSQLILDLGGNHKMSKGTINFKTKTSNAEKVYNGRTNVSKSFNFDYSHDYEMSVFYMERGMLESNCHIDFTMVPLGNNVVLTEKINTTNINNGLKAAVAAADKFHFTPYENGSVKSGVDYTTEDGSIASLGSSGLDLASGGSASFADKFSTNKTVRFVQTHPTSNLSYTTSWVFKDLESGAQTSGSTKDTGTKTLIAPSGDVYDFAALEADFENTPASAPLDVSKKIFGEGNSTTPLTNVSSTFSFTIGIDVKGGTNYSYYDLDYSTGTTNSTMNDGEFSFNSDDTVTIKGLPVGASYKIVEKPAAGYTCMNNQSTITGTVNTSNNKAEFNNRITTTTTKLDVTKTVSYVSGVNGGNAIYSSLDYSGDLFTFNVEAVSPEDFPSHRFKGKELKDASQTILVGGNLVGEASSNNVVNGELSFDLKYSQTGSYLYKVSESQTVANPGGDSTHYDADFSTDSTVYYVLFNVSGSGSALAISDPQFYLPVYYDPASGTTAPSDPLKPIDYVFQSGVSEASFDNKIVPGSVTISKEDQEGSSVNNVEFALFKVGDDENLSRDAIAGEVAKFKNSQASKCVNATVTESGSATFENLMVFKGGFNSIGLNADSSNPTAKKTPEYQRYAIAEVDPTNGYNLNGEVHYFTLPMWSVDDSEWKYDITFDYVNGKIVNPNTSGEGMMIFKTIGLSLLGASLLLLVGFAGYHSKKRRAYEKHAKHYIPKH